MDELRECLELCILLKKRLEETAEEFHSSVVSSEICAQFEILLEEEKDRIFELESKIQWLIDEKNLVAL